MPVLTVQKEGNVLVLVEGAIVVGLNFSEIQLNEIVFI